MGKSPDYDAIFDGDADKSAIASRVFTEVSEHLEKSNLATSRRLDIADRYARACAEYEVIYPVAAKEGPVKVGPNGGDVFNFNWSAVEKLNDRLAKFEDQLRLDLRHTDVGEVKPPVKPTKADDYLD